MGVRTRSKDPKPKRGFEQPLSSPSKPTPNAFH